MHVIKRIPLGGGTRRRVDRCRGQFCAGPSAPSPMSLSHWAPMCHSAWWADAALVEGTGEGVTPLHLLQGQRRFLLLVPPFGVNTALVYDAWDELAKEPPPDGRAPQEGDGTEMVNALTQAALAVEPRLALWRDAMAHLTGQQPTPGR